MLLLGREAWNENWSLFEWGILSRQPTPVTVHLPEWDGSSLRGRHILLVADQGFGDTLPFLRCFPLLNDQGAIVSILGPYQTTPLLARLPYVAHARTYLQDIPPAEVYLRLLSLPSRVAADQTVFAARSSYDSFPQRKKRDLNDASTLMVRQSDHDQ